MRTVLRVLIGGVVAVLLSFSTHAAQTSAPANYQGLWWNAPAGSESGWGISLAHQGDSILAVWFTYDASGTGWWLSMTANKTAEGTYSGTLIESTGPAFKAIPFDPSKVARTAVGTGTLTFRDQDSGTFSYAVNGVQRTKFITRMVFGPLPTCTTASQSDLVAATNYQDLWWVAGGAESGWGVNLTHQGDNIFATWFTYDTDGTPLWLAATAARTAQGVYSGALVRTKGPAFNAVPFDPAKVTRAEVGTLTLTFTSGNQATFAYTLNGVSQTKAITRLLFAPQSGTRCGEPKRTTTSFTVVAAGDIAKCAGYYSFDASAAAASAAAMTAKLVSAGDTFVLTLGDAAYESGTAAEYANCFHATWGALKDRIRPAPGNHDYYTNGASGYFDYFGAQAGPNRRGYYSFDHGGWHFISLNSVMDISPSSEQYRWLIQDLANSKDSPCTIALLHYPAFNSGATHGSIMAMRPAFEALYNAGVEILLSGHEHVYERFAPQKPDGTADPARGVRQFVVGTGGAVLMDFGRPLPNSEFRYKETWGVLRLMLGEGNYGWQYVRVGDGAPVDAGTGTCHR